MGEWLLSRRDRMIVARHEYVFSARGLGASLNASRRDRMTVARRFIAGITIHRICVPEGRLKWDIYKSSPQGIFRPEGVGGLSPGFQP
jgi:hypothetical protein